MGGQFLMDIEESKAVESETLSVLKQPRRYKVLLLNDDYTPMDFVVEVLKHFFRLSDEVAVQIMLQVHTQGQGVCGVFTRDIAETKVALVNDFSRAKEHPLLCRMEPE